MYDPKVKDKEDEWDIHTTHEKPEYNDDLYDH
jgi:hypothetical protein